MIEFPSLFFFFFLNMDKFPYYSYEPLQKILRPASSIW